MQYAGSRFVEHDCPSSENRAKCLANQLFEETPECGGVKIEGDLIYFENAFGRGGDCAPIIADDFRIRVHHPLNRYISDIILYLNVRFNLYILSPMRIKWC